MVSSWCARRLETHKECKHDLPFVGCENKLASALHQVLMVESSVYRFQSTAASKAITGWKVSPNSCARFRWCFQHPISMRTETRVAVVFIDCILAIVTKVCGYPIALSASIAIDRPVMFVCASQFMLDVGSQLSLSARAIKFL